MSKITDAFGEAPPVQSAPATPSGPIPIALRLDVTVSTPHATPTTVRRPIFDRVSAADRAAGRAATAPLAANSQVPFGTVWSVGVNLGSGVAGGGDLKLARPR